MSTEMHLCLFIPRYHPYNITLFQIYVGADFQKLSQTAVRCLIRKICEMFAGSITEVLSY